MDSLSLCDEVLSLQNEGNDVKSLSTQYSNDSDECKSLKSSNLHLSESSVSSASEFSISGSSEDSEASRATDNETNNREKLPVGFLKAFLPWTGKSSSTKPAPRHAEKVGGTLALIQYPRPANLPSKSATEERLHRKQYHRILEEARKREKREEIARQQSREEQIKREERLSIDSSLWYTEILPKFESLRDTKRVRELWWCGLPSSIRGKVWKLGISNELNIAPNEYYLCLERITDRSVNNESLAAIKLDVARTFPILGVFQEGGPLFEALQGVLAAYTVYRSDIGYVQGMSFIGAILTLNMEPNDAFTCFANLLANPCHRAAFTLNQKQMNVYYEVFASALAHKIPKVHLHFCACGLSPDLYLLDWLYTIYAKAMPLDVACRVWDVFVRDGDEFLFRTALGILRMYQEELLRMDFIRCAQFLLKLPENLQASALFDNIRQITTSCALTVDFSKTKAPRPIPSIEHFVFPIKRTTRIQPQIVMPKES